MKVFSTFSGIGGFEIGIQRAFDNRPNLRNGVEGLQQDSTNATQSQVRAECIGYSEIDKYAIQTYEKNFGKEVNNYGDITKINAKELPDFDCLVGGFPCQAFSVAGKRKGFEDTRGTLFFDLARILRAKQPRLFVFENVKGLLSHDSGRTFKTIIQTIDELGYDCQWQVLNSKNHGVPQNRERVYIVGHLRGTARPQVFPIDRANEKDIVQINQPKHLAIDYTVKSDKKDFRVFSDKGIAPSLQARSDTHKLGDDIKIRRLTPLETERLQGFPDNWTAQGIDGAISDTQRYKMCGNAVTTNVVQAVFERIFNSIKEQN